MSLNFLLQIVARAFAGSFEIVSGAYSVELADHDGTGCEEYWSFVARKLWQSKPTEWVYRVAPPPDRHLPEMHSELRMLGVKIED